MADGSGVSGIAVGVVAIGGLLVVSAIRNVTPLDTLRTVIGKPGSGSPVGPALGSVASGVRSVREVGEATGKAVGEVAGVAAGDAGRLVSAARKYLGVKYVYGGTTAKGIDCSGLVYRALKDMGFAAPRGGDEAGGMRLSPGSIPRFTTATFGTWAKSIGAKRLKPDEFRFGDVILRPGHMAIALSATRMIAAPHTGTVVKEQDIYSKSTWWGWRLF